jgi:hypothetical protein
MLIQELFRRVVVGRCQVMQDIAEILVPAIMREFAAVPALGGSGKPLTIHEPELQELLERIPAYTAEDRQRFSEKGFDQSLSLNPPHQWIICGNESGGASTGTERTGHCWTANLGAWLHSA